MYIHTPRYRSFFFFFCRDYSALFYYQTIDLCQHGISLNLLISFADWEIYAQPQLLNTNEGFLTTGSVFRSGTITDALTTLFENHAQI